MALLNQTQQQYYSGSDYGNYQFTSLEHIINQFMVAYVGEDKIISKVKRTDVQFHAMRALQELSFDTFKSCKSQEITVPASLTMILPQDYVNYTKISWSDSSGIKHRLYPTLCNTSNPTNPYQNSDGDFSLSVKGKILSGSSWVVLDDIYTNIKIGDIVSGPLMDNHVSTPSTGWVVGDVGTYLGNTYFIPASVIPYVRACHIVNLLAPISFNRLSWTASSICVSRPASQSLILSVPI